MTKQEESNIDDLKKLVFWAHVGTLYSQGGSYVDTIPKIIVKYMKKLGMNPSNFCCFEIPFDKCVARDVYKEWKKYNKGIKSK